MSFLVEIDHQDAKRKRNMFKHCPSLPLYNAPQTLGPYNHGPMDVIRAIRNRAERGACSLQTANGRRRMGSPKIAYQVAGIVPPARVNSESGPLRPGGALQEARFRLQRAGSLPQRVGIPL